MYASPLCRKSLSVAKFLFLSSKRAFPDRPALPSFTKGRCSIYMLQPSGEGEVQVQVMTAVPQQLLVEGKSGDNHSEAALWWQQDAAGHSGFHWICSSPTGTPKYHPQAAGTGQAAPILSGILRSDDTCMTESFLKPAWLSSALWICLLLPAYFLPLTTSVVLLTLCVM